MTMKINNLILTISSFLVIINSSISQNSRSIKFQDYQHFRVGNNENLIVAADDEDCFVWDFEKGSLVYDAFNHSRDLIYIQVGEDDKFLYTASSNYIRVWQIKAEILVAEYESGWLNNFTAVEKNPNKSEFAIADVDGDITFWNWETNEIVDLDMRHSTKNSGSLGFEHVNRLRFSNDGQFLISGADDGIINIWTHSGLFKTLSGQNSGITHLEYSPNGSKLVVGGADEKMKIWNTDTWEIENTMKVGVVFGWIDDSYILVGNHSYLGICNITNYNTSIVWDVKNHTLWHSQISPDRNRIYLIESHSEGLFSEEVFLLYRYSTDDLFQNVIQKREVTWDKSEGSIPNVDVSFNPYFLPFSLSISKSGIKIKGSQKFVTPIGVVSLNASKKVWEYDVLGNEISNQDLIISLVDRSNDKEHLFRISGGRKLIVHLSGDIKLEAQDNFISIDISNGNIQEIRFEKVYK